MCVHCTVVLYITIFLYQYTVQSEIHIDIYCGWKCIWTSIFPQNSHFYFLVYYPWILKFLNPSLNFPLQTTLLLAIFSSMERKTDRTTKPKCRATSDLYSIWSSVDDCNKWVRSFLALGECVISSLQGVRLSWETELRSGSDKYFEMLYLW